MPSPDSPCPFCNIAEAYPPTPNPSTDYERISPSAFVVLSTPQCMAFLDIMPLSPGHLLVTTRIHHEKISDVSEEESKELGIWLPRLSRVLANVTGVWDWNIVQNNGMAPSRVPLCVFLSGANWVILQELLLRKSYHMCIFISFPDQRSHQSYGIDHSQCLGEVREVSLMMTKLSS